MNRNQIKYLVIIAMMIDHIAAAFLPDESLLAMIMHFVGRFTAPAMAYFIAEGYHYTRNVRKYAIRLAVFAAISWLPYSLFETGTVTLHFSVIYTFLLGLLAVWLSDTQRCPMILKIVGLAVIGFLSFFGDWLIFVPMWCVVFHLFFIKPSEKEKKKHIIGWNIYGMIGYVYCKLIFESSVPRYSGSWSLGIFAVPFIIAFAYNGEYGSKKPFHKWFFYIFYPLHLFLLFALKYLFNMISQ